ncbi:MAG: hypothetical protein J0I98_11460 [Mesorhizobium sp.]|nr:hypothetical protein [Mesorhizobium sp.]MBN9243401.1 hypothetical protein [Mesorhizobium sp.]
MTRRCVVCEAGTVDDPHHAVCETCAAAREHVVSMTRAAITADSVATCTCCGWMSVKSWSHAGRAAQDEAVRRHWRDVVRRAR